MTIACLGWGSLIWGPGNLSDRLMLPDDGDWNLDGPKLPIEFARQSENGRITLVITPEADSISVLWAKLNCASIEEARELLQRRENTGNDQIGFWSANENAQFPHAEDIGEWANGHDLTGVVWTALPPGLRNNGRVPENASVPIQGQVIEYLENLTGVAEERAREYVERAPRQIETVYRQAIREELDWDTRGD